jgi:ribonucleoside-diphosphate reductase alpha chain
MTISNLNHVKNLNLNFVNLNVIKRNGALQKFEFAKFTKFIYRVAVNTAIDKEILINEISKNFFDKISSTEIEKLSILASVSMIELDTDYDIVACRILLQSNYKEILQKSLESNFEDNIKNAFISNIKQAIDADVLDSRMSQFDLNFLAANISTDRDKLFNYIGLETVINRYVLKINDKKIETPQAFWMRVAMGLAILEKDFNHKAVEFYNLISQLMFVPSTPTLLHAGLKRAQLSSCFLTTVSDDLEQIFKSLKDNALMSKWSGGVANDWTNIRGTGAKIKSIQVESQGLIPFLKIANDVTVAINRSGKRRGATVAYLECWHYDFEEFIDLRRNTGDERRRAHDISLAAWIPDLFIKRVIEDGTWTLFSPDEVSDLHDLYGIAFEEKYKYYELCITKNKIKLHKTIQAKDLWRKILTRLFETGFPWVTFKDACNLRSPQDHEGVVHSSNLCTEITLNTSQDEIAVCNLGSINLARHFSVDNQFDYDLFSKNISVAVRMLDNVIDLNFYPTIECQNSNLRHRPIGLGMMGFADALIRQNISFACSKAIEFTDEITELFSYLAIQSSAALAQEKGAYSTFAGSKWSRGIMPLDTIDILERERNYQINQDRSFKKDWISLRNFVKKNGMRNSNIMAIAPTATISNIAGCSPCIEPNYSNIFVESNMLGEFTLVNKYLINDLKQLNLWNKEMLDLIKYYDGSIQQIEIIPEFLKTKYQTAFEIDPLRLIEIQSYRAKWIDQSISHNIFVKGATGKILNDIYLAAWSCGLKTTYYLRTMAATQIEKSTLDSKYGFTQKRVYQDLNPNCLLDDSDCQSCQ